MIPHKPHPPMPSKYLCRRLRNCRFGPNYAVRHAKTGEILTCFQPEAGHVSLICGLWAVRLLSSQRRDYLTAIFSMCVHEWFRNFPDKFGFRAVISRGKVGLSIRWMFMPFEITSKLDSTTVISHSIIFDRFRIGLKDEFWRHFHHVLVFTVTIIGVSPASSSLRIEMVLKVQLFQGTVFFLWS